MRRAVLYTSALAAAALLAGAAALDGAPRFEPVLRARVDTATSDDPVARLQARMDAGQITLVRDSVLGYLPAVLSALRVPVSSQGLVFSRTSLQTDRIAPWSPRALYFNDDVYVGYVRDGHILEIATVDRRKGAVFYTLSQEPTARPTFAREGGTCLMCHQSRATGGVPGFMIRSTIADRNGYPIVGAHEGTTTDETPVRERFGGWYVTGTHGKAGHSGNVLSPLLSHEITDKEQYPRRIDLRAESERSDLAGKFDATVYLSAHSDLVALMVLVHQTSVHNLITVVHRLAQDADETSVRLSAAVDALVGAMLFAQEAPLDAPVRGTTTFAADFAKLGPFDAKGRTLREFDLRTRLFRYPMSFLVYSESFDALPDVARRMVYRRLHAVLSEANPRAPFTRLTPSDQQAIREILTATKPEFAASTIR